MRATQPDRSTVAEDELGAYDSIAQRNAERNARDTSGPRHDYSASYYYGALTHSPDLAKRANDLGDFFNTLPVSPKASYSQADRDFVDLAVGQELGCNMLFSQHLTAVARGVRGEALKALRAGRDEDLTPGELGLLEYTRAVIGGTVTDQQYEAIRTRYGDRGAVELTAFVSTLIMVARMMQAFDLPAPTDGELDELVDAFAASTAR